MTEPTELMPCAFCGAAAHFEMDEGRWEWVECESCGMQGNRSASLMEDCKPKLAEAWNRRTPAPVGVEPVAEVESAVRGAGGFHARLAAGAAMPSVGTKLYTTPQPTHAQVGAVPLTDGQIRAMAREHPAEDLCGWSYRMGIADTERHHGIKGGQHGADI